MYKITNVLFLLVLGIWQMNCSRYLHQPLNDQLARIGEDTEITRQLRALPEPTEPLYAAVYKFRDQTGQYRPLEVGTGFSTVVTQGATNILIKALEESGWFKPIERENIGNLLNERKIIRSSRIQYEGIEGPGVPPLKFANLILEGGIVSYDANLVTGGAGARYFGAGGQIRYRQDRVTVYLRVVATNTGEILKTVYTSKTILSQALDGGVFRFVSFNRLLEVETGYTYNEPSDLAVMEAIEKAVYCLIMEGIKGGFWDVPSGKIKERNKLIAEYDAEVAAMRETNMFGRKVFYKPTGFAFRGGLNGNFFKGDLPNSQVRPGFELGLDFFFSPSFGVQATGGFGQFSNRDFYQENILFGDLSLVWRMLPWDRFSPILYGGGGLLFDQDGQRDEITARNYFQAHAGGGFEYFISDRLAVDLLFDYNYLLNDQIERIASGQFNDVFYRGRLGLKFFFGSSNGSNN